ncbi:MAG: hypothetical protein M1813_006686 [Trichoglossum hirsutum]|nr:MAG: hypothetical protein M1813_006686 [Trichoglossum hirsutum]
MVLATSSDSVRSKSLSLIRRTTIKPLYRKKPLQTPDATESLEIELQSLDIKRRKGLDLAAFSPMAEFAAAAAGNKLEIFSWDRKADLCWTPCWRVTVLRECMVASESMVAIALSKSLVAVAAKGGLEVYELHTDTAGQEDPTTLQEKQPVIQVTDVGKIKTIALSLETPETRGRVCVGTGDGRLLIWDILRDNDGHYTLMPQPPHKLHLEASNETALEIPSAVAFSDNGSRICVGSRNRHITIYRLEEGRWSLVRRFQLEGDFVSRRLLAPHRTN